MNPGLEKKTNKKKLQKYNKTIKAALWATFILPITYTINQQQHLK